MHGLDRCKILCYDRVHAPAALLHITIEPPQYADVGVGIHKQLDVKQVAELRLAEYASTVGGREQLAIEAFSKALEIIPWTIAENAGIDSIDAIIKLKTAHDKKKKDAAYYGLDLDTGEAVDMLERFVIEPLRVKVQAINSAAEVANMVLRIDDVIASRRAPPMNPMADPSMGGPGMSGIGGMM